MPSLFELQLKRNTRSNVGQAPEFLTDTATVSIVDCRLSIDMIFTDCRLTPEHRSLSTLTWSFWANIARHASSDIASPLSLCQQPADRTSWSRSAMAAWLGGTPVRWILTFPQSTFQIIWKIVIKFRINQIFWLLQIYSLKFYSIFYDNLMFQSYISVVVKRILKLSK